MGVEASAQKLLATRAMQTSLEKLSKFANATLRGVRSARGLARTPHGKSS